MKAVRAGSAVSHILVQVGEAVLESIITNEEAERLNLKAGDPVQVAIKPTQVALQRVRVAHGG